jgi:hypothetical protein
VAAMGAVGAVALLTAPDRPRAHPLAVAAPPVLASRSSVVRRADALAPKSLAELLALPPDQLERVDIGLMNLLCAEGLPGSKGLDVAGALGTMDKWAEAVAAETLLCFPQFERDPADYENSESYFRMLVLVTVLQRDLGVHYNPERINDPDFGNSKDQFIHGMVNCENGGTCVSMPVLYAAIARRLGYPVKLALAHDHVYCRWDDGKGTVKNFDGAGRGLTSYDDLHYREWPRPITDDEMKHREFLLSLAPAEELSVFLAARGHCLMDHRRYGEARAMYAGAAGLFPSASAYRKLVRTADSAANPPVLVQPGTPHDPLRDWGIPVPAVSSPRAR